MRTSIQKRGNRWTSSVRFNGNIVSQTFTDEDDARFWLRRIKSNIEAAISEGREFNPVSFKQAFKPPKKERLNPDTTNPDTSPTPSIQWTLKRAAQEYMEKVTEYKKSHKDERNRIKVLQSSNLGGMPLKKITPQNVHDYIKGLRNKSTGKELAPVSIRNTAFLISAIFETARKDKLRGGFGLTTLENPVKSIGLPKPPKAGQQRNIDPHIIDAFFEQLGKSKAVTTWDVQLSSFYIFALFTGMRRGELISLQWKDLQKTKEGYVINLKDSKSGYPRIIYLNEICNLSILNLALDKKEKDGDKGKKGEKIFSFSKEYVSRIFHETMTKIGYPEIRLHDLRHTALTSMASAGFSLKELMSQSGHRTASVAARYLHVNETTIREKIKVWNMKQIKT